MDQVFKRLVDSNFSDLSGAVLEASVPVPQSLLNEIAVSALKGNESISTMQVEVHAENRLSLQIKTTLLPWILNLKLKLDHSIDLASYSSPKIRAWLENNRALGSLGSLFNVLPEGVRLYGNQVVIDLRAFLPMPEQRRMLDLVKSVNVRTEENILILDIIARVD